MAELKLCQDCGQREAVYGHRQWCPKCYELRKREMRMRLGYQGAPLHALIGRAGLSFDDLAHMTDKQLLALDMMGPTQLARIRTAAPYQPPVNGSAPNEVAAPPRRDIADGLYAIAAGLEAIAAALISHKGPYDA